MITREKEPENLESLLSSLETFITPTEQFYVRNHFKQPPLALDSWTLKIEGAVAQPFEINYHDLLQLPRQTVTCMLECAGNGRVFLSPKEDGAQWGLGGVGNAEWTGIPLSALLEKAGVKTSAVEIIFEGADQGQIKEAAKSPGEINYARSVPVSKCNDILLAFQMNGSPLSGRHGAPLRALVPGWYGLASVKWLSRILVTDQPFHGFFQTLEYTYWHRLNGIPTLAPLTEVPVKSEIIRPALGEVVTRSTTYVVKGLAWAGESRIHKVEISADAGQTWAEATLVGPAIAFSWRMFEYEWQVPNSPGKHTLLSRATDDQGRSQPLERDKDSRSYRISHVLPVETEVIE